MKENINEHDMTKKMMDIIRGGYVKNLIKEDENMGQTMAQNNQPEGSFDSDDQNDTITLQPSDMEYKEELDELTTIVSPSVRITDFKIIPSEGEVIVSGYFNKGIGENTEIDFIMSLLARKIQITMNNIEVDDKVDEELTKLRGYYDNFSEKWYKKMGGEYAPKNI